MSETEQEHRERLHTAMVDEITNQMKELKADIESLKTLLAEVSSNPPKSASSRGRDLPEATCRKEGDEFIWDVPEGAPKGKCKYCQGTIIWVKSRRGIPCPINTDGKGHRDTCEVRKTEGGSPQAPSTEINVPF